MVASTPSKSTNGGANISKCNPRIQKMNFYSQLQIMSILFRNLILFGHLIHPRHSQGIFIFKNCLRSALASASAVLKKQTLQWLEMQYL